MKLTERVSLEQHYRNKTGGKPFPVGEWLAARGLRAALFECVLEVVGVDLFESVCRLHRDANAILNHEPR